MIITNNRKRTRMLHDSSEEALHHEKKPLIPPHERRGMITAQFDDTDWGVLIDVFGSEDEAFAAMGIIQGAPPEIQIIVAQILTQIEKEVA